MLESVTMTKILDGRAMSRNIEKTLLRKVSNLALRPKLVIMQVGNKEESNTYIRHKIAFAKRIGVAVWHKKYDEAVREESIVSDIKKYNRDNSMQGIIVQLPLPKRLSASRVLEVIQPDKDVDGLTSASVNALLRNESGFVSGATRAVMAILDREKVKVAGKKVVIVGRSTLVGIPTALALVNRNATVTICHEYTKNLAEETKRADILITAVGKPKLITKNHVAPRQIIIDIGITVVDGNRVTGDVDYDKVKDKVKAITPVPGGVGPITIACLFENLIEACAKKF